MVSNDIRIGGRKLLEQSKDVLNSLDIDKLKSEGIIRNRFQYEFLYQYPPPRALNKITEGVVYSPTQEVNGGKQKVALYVHLPFCTGRCSYCHYFTFSDETRDSVNQYLKAVEQELKLLLQIPQLQSMIITSVYLGGGTPTYLTCGQINNLMKVLKGNLNINPGAEISIEACPETIDEEKLAAVLKNGFNRLSIGIEAFRDHLLRICARRYSVEEAKAAVENAHRAGFENVDIDLIYGLPSQKFQNWEHTLDVLEEIRPESVATYLLRIHPGTAMSQMDSSRFCTEEESLRMHIMAIERLTKIGYMQSAPNCFVLSPEHLCRHQEHKWRNNELLALGLSAYSYMNGCVYHNERSMGRYLQTVHGNHLPIDVGRKLSKQEKMVRMMILGLKLSGVNRVEDGGLDKKEFKLRFGMSPREAFGNIIQKLEDLDLIEDTQDFLRLTYKGILFASEVCAKFYTPEDRKKLEEMKTKHGAYFINETKCYTREG